MRPTLINAPLFRRLGNNLRYTKDEMIYWVNRGFSESIDFIKYLTPESAILTISALEALNWSTTLLISPGFFRNSNYLQSIGPLTLVITIAVVFLAVIQTVSVFLMIQNRRRDEPDSLISYGMRMSSHFIAMGVWFFFGVVTTVALTSSTARTIAPHLALYIFLVVASFAYAPISTVQFKHRHDAPESLADSLPVPVP